MYTILYYSRIIYFYVYKFILESFMFIPFMLYLQIFTIDDVDV